MSDRGRPHNLGQALFEGLGAGLRVYGSFLEQERIRKSDATQQSFLNRLSVESGQRAQIGLDQGQQRIDNALIGGQSVNPNFISELDQSRIDQNNARTALLGGQLGQLGQGGGQTTAGTFNAIRGEVFRGFKERELGRQLDAQNPAFGTITQEQKPEGFFGSLNPFNNEFTDVFKPRENISLDEISIPADSLPALLRQVREIAGGAQLTPSTDLSNLGKETVFPTHDLDLIEAEGLARQWAESGGISDWAGLSEDVRRQIIDKLLSEGIPDGNR